TVPQALLVSSGELRQHEQALRWNVRGRELHSAAQWAVQVRGDSFDLDRWWPQAVTAALPATGTPTATPAARAEAAELWNPHWLEDLTLTLDLQLGALRARRLQAEQVRLALEVSDGLAQLKQLQARL